MKLNTSEWKEFLLPKIFSMVRGTRLTTYDRVTGNIPLVTAGEDNSGVSEYIGNIEQEKFYDTITIDMFGNCFYHRGVFCADDNILVLKNDDISMYAKLFISSVVNQDKYRYSYGRQYRQKNYIEHYIKLPIQYNPDGSPLLDNTYKYSEQGYVPDWQFMENYIKSLHYKPLTTKRVNEKKMELNVSQWEEFLLKDLFECRMGSGIDAQNTTNYNPKYNYVSRNSNDNGVVAFVDEMKDEELFSAGEMSLALGGSYLGSCFVQKEPFYTAQNVAVLKEREKLSTATKLFVATLVRNECRYKYLAFGRELNTHYKTDFCIRLPIQRNTDGSPVIDETKKYHNKGYIPDWQFMEDYINSLPYSDRIV